MPVHGEERERNVHALLCSSHGGCSSLLMELNQDGDEGKLLWLESQNTSERKQSLGNWSPTTFSESLAHSCNRAAVHQLSDKTGARMSFWILIQTHYTALLR